MTSNDDDDIRGLLRAIGRLEGKIDGVLSRYDGLNDDQKEMKIRQEKSEDHLLSRIGRIETRMNVYAGAVAVLTPVLFIALDKVAEGFL